MRRSIRGVESGRLLAATVWIVAMLAAAALTGAWWLLALLSAMAFILLIAPYVAAVEPKPKPERTLVATPADVLPPHWRPSEHFTHGRTLD